MSKSTNAEIQPEVVNSFDRLRLKLLDTSKRNPLNNVNLTAKRAKQIQIVDEISDQIFRLLYKEERTFSFLPEESELEEEPGEEENRVYVPEEQVAELKASHTDTKFQTVLTPADLHKRLLSLYRESKSVEEDLGVNVLYLALGILRYFESEASEIERTAPLILLPVDLKRDSSRAMFKLTAREDDLVTNQSLGLMLKDQFDVVLPTLPETEDWTPSGYFGYIEQAISSKPRWEVSHNSMVLRFFSFEKYMMSRDLEQSSLDLFNANGASTQVVNHLFGVSSSSTSTVGVSSHSLRTENAKLDEVYKDPKDLGHILDADTSQTRVIAAAMEGSNLVVQGPPGTGKSQTITNIIGNAVRNGKRVLFVAEKRAALEVVFRRLQNCGLGHMCLELHSHKANRKHFYQDIKSTLEPVEIPSVDETAFFEIRQTRDQLNNLTELLHELDETGNSPYMLMGRMSQLLGKGIKPADFVVDEIGTWHKEEFETKLNVLSVFAERLQQAGRVSEHPWHGTTKRLTPLDKTRLTDLVRDHRSLCEDNTSPDICHFLNLTESSANTVSQHKQILNYLELLSGRPESVSQFLESSVVIDHFEDVRDLIFSIQIQQELEQRLQVKVIDSAIGSDWEVTANAIRKHGQSFFKFLNGDYRAASKRLKSVSRDVISKNLGDQVELLDQLVECKKLRDNIQQQSALGREHFGATWIEHSTDIQEAAENIIWLENQLSKFESIQTIHDYLVQFPSRLNQETFCSELKNRIDAWETKWIDIEQILGLNMELAFGSPSILDIEMDTLVRKMDFWLENIDKLNEYHTLASTQNEAIELGLGNVVLALDDKRLEPEIAVDTVMLLRCEVLLSKATSRNPELAKINGAERTSLVETFKTHDKQLKALAAQEIVLKHDQEVPRGFSGQIGLLRGEANKKSRHMPIRQALDNAGEALTLIKPIFLMSPLSISRFLTPGKLSFDLLLIDEASQVKPEEALGGMLRSSQVIVVGDQKQMPPTSFFDKQVSNEPEEIDEDASLESIAQAQIGAMESVLSLCEARGFHSAMLNWHYRSEHPSLIEVSNHEFYDSKLIYPPTPNFGVGNVGLQLVKASGVYSRSRGRNNVIEAERLCEGILEHVSNYPGQSLGVVALSTAQRDTIQNKLDELCRDHSNLDQFCYAEHDESFFVKNLENVQGDERDVIFVSIGYGPDEDGKFLQNFGPVSSDGGERRLNVLFTRSRKRCVIYSSITHDQIRDDAARFEGPKVLKQYLKFAETGEMDVALITGEEMDSPFEEDVASVLIQHGHRVEAQVGAAGFKIDLAVYDPDEEGHFLLAIECDGARYHSSSWARERDRLRQEVLEQKGWRFHRIWSTDWFYSRETEVNKLLEAIERARSHQADFRAGSGKSLTKPKELRQPRVKLMEQTPLEGLGIQVVPYQETQMEIREISLEIHAVPMTILKGYIKRIIQIEQPVHITLISYRLARLWQKKRTGSRITEVVEKAIVELQQERLIRAIGFHGVIYSATSSSPIERVRDRSDVQLSQVKDPSFLPAEELRLAILALVHASVVIELTECTRELSKVLGMNTKRQVLEERVQSTVSSLASRGEIDIEGTTLKRKL